MLKQTRTLVSRRRLSAPTCRCVRPFPLASLMVTALLACVAREAPVRAAAEGELELRVVDEDTGKPLPVRVHLPGNIHLVSVDPAVVKVKLWD